jgi:hypothetical protein
LKALSLLVLGAVLTVTGAQAQTRELDPQIAPQEIIVRVDAQGNHEVFKVTAKNDIKDDHSAAAAIQTYVTAQNKVETVVAQSELDKVTSTESWYYYYRPYYNYGYNYGYNFGYNYYGYNYSYTPYYYYNYGYYNYYYYRYF